MKKRSERILSLCLLSIFVISIFALSINFAFAQTGSTWDEGVDVNTPTNVIVKGLGGFINGVQEVGKPLFNALLGDTSIGAAEASVTFPKILVFLLVLLIVMAVLNVVAASIFSGDDKIWLRFLIGAIVAILGVRFLPNDLIRQLALPSSALAASITIIIPFVIYGYFVYTTIKGGTFRRAAWVVFGAVFLVLWYQNYAKPWGYIYWLAIIGCGFLFFFDGLIYKLWFRGRGAIAYEKLTSRQRGRITVEIENLQRELLLNTTTMARKAEIRTEIKQLEKELKLK
ncbi:MAG: hypothetical protein WC781_02870 [Candidatus Pacearchaeota archaeon]|jgi:hypothetical protein